MLINHRTLQRSAPDDGHSPSPSDLVPDKVQGGEACFESSAAVTRIAVFETFGGFTSLHLHAERLYLHEFLGSSCARPLCKPLKALQSHRLVWPSLIARRILLFTAYAISLEDALPSPVIIVGFLRPLLPLLCAASLYRSYSLMAH
jgi:hypothetical protein